MYVIWKNLIKQEYQVFDTSNMVDSGVFDLYDIKRLKRAKVNIGIFNDDDLIMPIDYINVLADEYMAPSGASETALGEIISAICRIVYRFENDGDVIGAEYGRITCSPAYRYLIDNIPVLDEYFKPTENLAEYYNMSEDEYRDFIDLLMGIVAGYACDNFDSLSEIPNYESYNEFKNPEYDSEDYVNENDDEYYTDEDEGEGEIDYELLDY